MTYALAYTFELGLSLVTYFGAARHEERRVLLVVATSRCSRRRRRSRAAKFDPTTEFEQHQWVSIHLGPLNLSITKAVVYL